MAAKAAKSPKIMLEQRFLDHIYDGYQAGQRYCFVLGAGAAKASGIRTGEEMMREWREYLLEKGSDYIQDCAKDVGLEKRHYHRIFEDGYTLVNDDYFTLFDLRFAGKPNAAYAYLEKEMAEKYPSYGYFPLAMLLSNTENRLVITTNFDTLLEDALYTYTLKHSLVVGHESLASYIGSDARHPIIAKIHRDLLFRPFNRKKDMDKLKEEWEQPLRNALSRYIPIVIGYAGGDHTFMTMLQEIELNGIYWCHLGDTVSDKIKDTVAKHRGYMVKILGFDEIMFQIGERFANESNFRNPCQYMREQTEMRCRLYQDSLDKIKKKYEAQKSGPKDPPGNGDGNGNVVGLIDAIERYDNRQLSGEEEKDNINELQSEARRKLSLGKTEEALALYTQLIKLKPDDARYYERRSVALHKLGRYGEAASDDSKAIELEPENAEYYHSRSITLHEMGQYGQALEDENKAIELEPGNAEYYNGRGVTLYEMGQYDQALRDENKAIELEPENAQYYNNRGATLYEMGQYNQALRDETKAIELEPENAEYYYSRGVTLHEMGQCDQALEDRTKAVTLAPDNALYYEQRGVTLDKMRRYGQALEDKAKAIELDPENAEYYHSRGITLHEMGQYDQALEDETKAIELEPENAEYHYCRSLTLYEMKQYDQALEEGTKAIELEPENAEYHYCRSLILYKMKQYDQALEEGTRTIELEPENARYYRRRAITFRKIGKKTEADKDRRKAEEIETKSSNA